MNYEQLSLFDLDAIPEVKKERHAVSYMVLYYISLQGKRYYRGDDVNGCMMFTFNAARAHHFQNSEQALKKAQYIEQAFDAVCKDVTVKTEQREKITYLQPRTSKLFE